MSFTAGKGSLEVDLKAKAFRIQDTKISIIYEIDDKGHLFITKCGWAQEKEKNRKTSDAGDHRCEI